MTDQQIKTPWPDKQVLPGKRINMFGIDPDDLTIIGYDTKHKRGEHSLWDPRVYLPLDEAFVKNVMKFGILQNVSVRKNGKVLEVVKGRSRVRAAREANIRFEAEGAALRLVVPTVDVRGDDDRMVGFMISENEIRRNDEMLEKAEKAIIMLDLNGNDEDAVCIAFGVTTTTIRDWIAIAGLSKPVKTAIQNGEISPSAAAKLKDFSRDEQVKQLEILKAEAGGKRVTNKQVKRATKKVKGKKADSGEKPGLRLLKKLVNLGIEEKWNEDFLKGVRYAIGELTPTTVSGLVELIRKAEGGK